MASTDTAGLVRLTGAVEPQSDVFAKNHSTGKSFGQYTESGLYDFTIEAQDGDAITLWYTQGNIESPPAEFVIKFVAPPTP